MSRLSYFAGSQSEADPDRDNRVARRIAAMLRQLATSPLVLGQIAVDRVVHWHVRRKTIETLNGLDDRILKDVGLFRGDIESIADGLILQSRTEKAVNANRLSRRSERTGAPVPMGCG